MTEMRTMSPSDVPLGMRLKEAAGWNQTIADWHRFLDMEPQGCFVAELDGRPVGTATTCVLGSIGWIAMVLVDPAVRGRGVGTRLVEHAIEYLDARSIDTARLDATALGQPIYERLGFTAEYELGRWEGVAGGGAAHSEVRAPTPDESDALVALDRGITGTDRRPLLRHLDRQQPGAMRVASPQGKLTGYLTFREGSRAVQLGPGVARDDAAASALLDAALESCVGRPVFIDIPSANAVATRWAQSHGLSVQRCFMRMRRGAPVADRPAAILASSGPETG